MKQVTLFNDNQEDKSDKAYTSKIGAPIYEPKYRKPHELELYDSSKTKRLITEIKGANIKEEEKTFLIEAARRHTVFNYEKIADYYAKAPKEVQELMEKSALVIIDFEKAIELGYIQLSKDIRKQYLEENAE